ncbi:transcription initiation factor IID, TAF10 subunit [Aureobasidium pullulans]|nr:transcription initiation factor IID, TAF10 subunit [Aureobasidium pullulans]THV98680.1 transcription initiation factor IID, TAF10 subunit [Aureobasidium pullulans]THW03956.1 transcription initiation factor IID, TAF10 subunit [Aureobasidium pullulans]THW18077.1 transcription initiation factor IID, TAF10 subunit [Aureobasidium pullulans]THW24912.1 transcription initiation factor IID, TAF10 subunit [Aureobasidium pullulans]
MADTEDRAQGDTKAEAPQATTEQPTAAPAADDIEASIDQEMQSADHDDSSHTMDNSSNSKSGTTLGLDGTSDEPPTVPQIETRMPAKKDVALRDFLGKMDEYAPIIPDAVTNYYLTLAGLPPPPATPPHLARLLALAAQKFIADIAADAYQYSRIRSTNTTSNNPLTGLGGAAGFGMMPTEEGGAKGKGKDAAKGAQIGGPRPGYGGGGVGSSGGRTVLTMEDLGMAVGEYGVNVKRGEFYR